MPNGRVQGIKGEVVKGAWGRQGKGRGEGRGRREKGRGEGEKKGRGEEG